MYHAVIEGDESVPGGDISVQGMIAPKPGGSYTKFPGVFQAELRWSGGKNNNGNYIWVALA